MRNRREETRKRNNMYSVFLVAKHLIRYSNATDHPVNNLKLQKLLYFIQAEFLACTDAPCFPEEIEAWDFGPVVPEVYYQYNIYGSTNIPDIGDSVFGRISPSDKSRIEDIVDQCADYSAAQLTEITHQQEPWIKAYAPYKRNVITKKSIKFFFAKCGNETNCQ